MATYDIAALKDILGGNTYPGRGNPVISRKNRI